MTPRGRGKRKAESRNSIALNRLHHWRRATGNHWGRAPARADSIGIPAAPPCQTGKPALRQVLLPGLYLFPSQGLLLVLVLVLLVLVRGSLPAPAPVLDARAAMAGSVHRPGAAAVRRGRPSLEVRRATQANHQC